jgi:hypothetical protein
MARDRNHQNKQSKDDTSDFVKIAGAVAGIYMIIAVMILIFAKDSIQLLIPIAWAFVIFGIALGLFQYLSNIKK